MNVDESFLRQLASEIARLQIEVGAILTAVEPLGVNIQAIRQATDLAAESDMFQVFAQDIFERLQASR